MVASIEQVIGSTGALKLAVSIARATPPGLGYPIARLAAGWISARRNSSLVRAVRSNQWVVAGEIGAPQLLDQTVKAVFRYSGYSIYELYHHIQSPEEIARLYTIDRSFQPILDCPEFDRRGLVVAGFHMAGFDLGLQCLRLNQFKPLVITLPDPKRGRLLEFETRQKSGIDMALGSFSGMRQAIRHLQRGGIVLTGIDHPLPGLDHQPCFFGHPAALPVHHVFLALRTHVPVVIAFTRLEEDGKYHIHASEAIEMNPYPDRVEELLINAEKVLDMAAAFIRKAPQQWLIFQPVWPAMLADKI